ncbi:YdcF family protein [Enterovirga rhinocerotis]|uniref:YdcF family protein n=1 Tax=Enterovirga rhinocerotis TaxID=1339210 RepID=UPI0014151C83|nr:YdcF family protein [Enterovirga rhinocerotis]
MSPRTGPPAVEKPAAGPRKPGWFRRVLQLVVLPVLVIGGLFAGGFGVFVWSLDRSESEPAMAADAIVALTGGQGRVEDALQLLAQGWGTRLLITGVNERTSRDSILALSPALRGIVDCCVDLDYRARNTVDNAAEIRRWVEERGFRSLIVVTSYYHLPRTLAELNEALPGVRKIPHAVVGTRTGEAWDATLARGRVILMEYMKFLAVSVRTRMAGWTGADHHAEALREAHPLAKSGRTG